MLKGKDFFVLTTNQDTQFVKLYPESKVAAIQGDHRFFQCAACCTDDTWDAVKPVAEMMDAMGEGTSIPKTMIPRCPHCCLVYTSKGLILFHERVVFDLADYRSICLYGIESMIWK